MGSVTTVEPTVTARPNATTWIFKWPQKGKEKNKGKNKQGKLARAVFCCGVCQEDETFDAWWLGSMIALPLESRMRGGGRGSTSTPDERDTQVCCSDRA